MREDIKPQVFILPDVIEGKPVHRPFSHARRFGVYFPGTDLCVTDMGGRGTGRPEGVTWVVDELLAATPPIDFGVAEMHDDQLKKRVEALESLLQGALSTAYTAIQLASHNSQRIHDMAKTLAQIQQAQAALLQQVDTYTTEIGEDLTRIAATLQGFKDQIDNGTLVQAEQLQPLIDALQQRATALQQVAVSADNVVPDVPLPPLPDPSSSSSSGSASSGGSSGPFVPSGGSDSGSVASSSGTDAGSSSGTTDASSSSSGSSASSSGSSSDSASGSSSGPEVSSSSGTASVPSESVSVAASSSAPVASSSSSASGAIPAPGDVGLPTFLQSVSGYVVTAEGMPVYTFDGDPAEVDPIAWPPLNVDAQQATYQGKLLYTFVADTPNNLPPRGDGGDGNVWHAVRF